METKGSQIPTYDWIKVDLSLVVHAQGEPGNEASLMFKIDGQK